jgi:hypothetical protein
MDVGYIQYHTCALPIATEPYIIDNEPFSIYSEIEVNTGVDAVQNEVIFDYIHYMKGERNKSLSFFSK